MRVFLSLAIGVLLSAGSFSAAVAQPCESSPKRNARFLAGEISGNSTFSQSITDDWIIKLLPAAYGWDLRLGDKNGLDLSQITPPFRTAPNTRELYGWHFRNSTNTGTNIGDVNAPQQSRVFFFPPALTGTGGFNPSSPGTASGSTPDETAGRGLLRILDIGLSDLSEGEKARMSYLKFSVCLSWPKTVEEIHAEKVTSNPSYDDADRQLIYGCGLDYKKFALSAWLLPRLLEGDVDGDGALDQFAPIIRKRDGRRGLAICRAGTWVSLYGYGADAQKPMKTKSGEPRSKTYVNLETYLSQTESWGIRRNKDRDEIILKRIEKAEVAVRWQRGQFIHELLWINVEP